MRGDPYRNICMYLYSLRLFSKGHCMVSINETTVLLTGGYGNDWPPSGSSYLSYFFNVITYQWTPGPSMMNSYVYHDCTILKTNGTTIAMLANNYRVEFLDLQNPSEWYLGKRK